MILEGEKDLSEVLWPDQKINKKNTGTCSKSRNVRADRSGENNYRNGSFNKNVVTETLT